jgi:hemolysin-activating ACP:hemolysin acyltransferase
MIFGSRRKDAPDNAPRVAEATNGSGPPAPAVAAPAAPKKPASSGDVRQVRMAQSFAQIVAVLMRDPAYKNLKVADLAWLVLPAVTAGQFRLAHSPTPVEPGKAEQGGGVLVPVAVALWARVSPAVDKSLSESLDKSVQLSPAAWTSGDILWLMAVAGDRRATPAFIRQLQEKEFKGKQVKMRLRSPDGKLVVGDLGQTASAA